MRFSWFELISELNVSFPFIYNGIDEELIVFEEGVCFLS